jgi:putative ABC transport system permease protein
MGGAGTTRPPMTIVGVVRTSRHNSIVEEPRAEMYLPHAQVMRAVGGPGRAMAVVVKTATDPLAHAEALRQIVRSMDRNLPVADIRSMDRITATALAGPRFAALLLGVFAALALTLAAVGAYATISLLVSDRSREIEIGIRMALGAERRAIMTWILAEGTLLAGGGIAVGGVAAVLATRLLTSLLYGVTPLDPATFASVAVLLMAAAATASLRPAYRAASLDPARTLRQG